MIIDLTEKNIDTELKHRKICDEIINNHILAAKILGVAKKVVPNYYDSLAEFIKTLRKNRFHKP